MKPAAEYPIPVVRRLRAFASDPTLRNHLDTVLLSAVTFKLPWEPLEAGPLPNQVEIAVEKEYIDVTLVMNSYYETSNQPDGIMNRNWKRMTSRGR